MKTMKITLGYILLGVLLIFSWNGSANAATLGSLPADKVDQAPWFPDANPLGKTEYAGTLYVTAEDSGRTYIPGEDIGVQTMEDYREYVVSIKFILELRSKKGNDAPLYFSGVGKTCDWIESPYAGGGYFPECPEDVDTGYDLFYLPGDYSRRIGAALSSFLKQVVYPQLCDSYGCGSLSEADRSLGQGNILDVIDPDKEPPPHPWYWVQPITIVTP